MKTRLLRLFIMLVIGLGKDIQLSVEMKFYIFSSRILSLVLMLQGKPLSYFRLYIIKQGI